jgi:hypothetical protein
MPSRTELDYWVEEVSTAFSSLSRSQASVLALYSYGIMITSQCGQTIVSSFLAELLQVRWHAMRQRLREWLYDASDKRGTQRQEVDVQKLFGPLLRWLLSHWRTASRLTLVLDVTYLRQRHTLLVASVVYRGCAVPVAWHIMRGETPGAWHPLWVNLLDTLSQAVPSRCQVWVLCDEGLYSKRLFGYITGHGWHPLMRIRIQGLYRRAHGLRWRALAQGARRGMTPKAFRADCFKGDPLRCTLWVQWALAYDQPCLLVTDVMPKHLKRHLYGQRAWVEAGFQDLKRGGLHLEHSKIPCPQRLSRLMFVISVALVRLMSEGVSEMSTTTRWLAGAALSLIRRGWVILLAAALRQDAKAFAYWPPYSFPPIPK